MIAELLNPKPLGREFESYMDRSLLYNITQHTFISEHKVSIGTEKKSKKRRRRKKKKHIDNRL